jgi:hypothetical protein
MAGNECHTHLVRVCYLDDVNRDQLLWHLENIVVAARDRHASLQKVAALIRSSNNYRRVGLYDDVESEEPNAFTKNIEDLLEAVPR